MRWLWLAMGFWVLGLGVGAGQGIAWEIRIGWDLQDKLNDIVLLPSGDEVMCVGNSQHFNSEIVLLKASVITGDTSWVKSIGFSGVRPQLCLGDSGFVYLVARASLPQQAIAIWKLDEEGNILSQVQVRGTDDVHEVNQVIRLTDNTLILVGEKVAQQGTGNQVDMFVARIDPETGLIYFNEPYSDHPYTLGNHVELTPQGTFLASGTAGSRIWAIEIDTNGVEIRRQTFYQTPTHAIFGQSACVKQAPDGRYIASGSPLNFSPGFSYMGSYDSFSSMNELWGGEHTGQCLPPHIQDDGSIVIYWNRQGSNYLTKLASDSTRIWDVRVQSQLGSSQPTTSAFAYMGDSSVIGVGSIYFSGRLNQDFYLCRIKNVGVPFDPAHPVATMPRYKGLPPLIAYPSPTLGPLTVHTRSRLPLQLYSLSGQKVLEAGADGSGTTVLDISGLPRGVYVLRQGENTLRVVKN